MIQNSQIMAGDSPCRESEQVQTPGNGGKKPHQHKGHYLYGLSPRSAGEMAPRELGTFEQSWPLQI
ncbi:hypothetical protein RLOC_00008286 [Lonchura striata]|uniref:Uncharacterized protein n=1 Tax=Lonchura striata TaxID=40157 RepID=A0A218UDS8_9PASE|nr:hypothetical protein RLOC_00008286 [Lonchura striata domestica]